MIVRTQITPDGSPDLPDVAGFALLERHDDGTATYDVTGTPEQLAAAERHAAALGTHVPQSVRSEQFWLALLTLDEALFDQIDAMVEQNKRARVARWQAATVSRDSQILQAVQQQAGVSDDLLDQLFQAAVQVET